MMANLSAEQVKTEFEKAFSTRQIMWCTLYENFWYICAVDPSDPDEGEMNPFFKVSALTGAISEFYVVQNILLFQKIVKQVEDSGSA